jgi:hypothetical protein
MGEAKRRRTAAALSSQTNNETTIPPGMTVDFFKGIFLQIQRTEFRGPPGLGGTWVFKTLAAYQAVCACKLDASIGFGALLCRIDPDEMRDVVAFCGPCNVGFINPNGESGYHCWLRHEDWIFDASVGEWHGLDPVKSEITVLGRASFGPPQWTITLPDYWLKNAREAEQAWRPEGTPALGEAWYGPMLGDPNIVMNRLREVHEDVGKNIAACLTQIFNNYCRQHGIGHVRDDEVYPLKFRTATALSSAIR